MSTGTIHPVDQNLFLVEGERPSWLPGAAVLRSGDRLYLLDTGAGPHQRSAIQAVAASFAPAGELLLVNSGDHPGLVGNNDLLDTCAARAQTHLRPNVISAFDAPSVPAEVARILAGYPSPRPTLVPAEPLEAVTEATRLVAGGITWAGWRLADDLLIVQVTARTGRLAFLLPDQRALLLPEELLLAPRWPGSDLADVARVSSLVSALHGEGIVDVVSLGFGVPLDVAAARSALDAVTGQRLGD